MVKVFPLTLNKFKTLAFVSIITSVPIGLSAYAENAPTPPIASLKTATIPTPTNMSMFVKDDESLVALGKALFWDNAAGFDGQACASCHYHAGADSRFKNQISPNGASLASAFSEMQSGAGGPNYTLKTEDFPLFVLQDPDDRHSAILYDTDDTVTSMGTWEAAVVVNDITGQDDDCKIMPDITFHVNGYNTRKTEPRNTPSTINAVFNFRQFWDGRANNEFNGVDPFGPRNPDATLLRHDGNGNYTPVSVLMQNASLASQAVGPILSTFEMNCADRQISHVARKLLPMQALEYQKVLSTDSVLGSLAAPEKGLTVNYQTLVQNAFKDQWWNGDSQINGFSQIESNFSLFYGLALQAYQATLVSDDSRFDRYMDGDSSALSTKEQQGLAVFVSKGKCVACHNGPELSSAATHLQGENQEGGLVERMRMALTNNGESQFVESWVRCTDALGICYNGAQTYRFVTANGVISDTRNYSNAWCLSWMYGLSYYENAGGYCEYKTVTEVPAEGFLALYDNGFYNIGVTPTIEDIGVGAQDPWGNPLSFTRQEKFRASGQDNLAPDNFFTDPNKLEVNPGVPVQANERDAVDGAFKTPILRNLELTGPYMHNGDQLTLEQLVDFYNRGGNRQDNGGLDADRAQCDTTGLNENCTNLDPDITQLNLSQSEKEALVAFMRALTDERVRWEEAPFDHPELIIPLGHVGDEFSVEPERRFQKGVAKQELFTLPAVGADGRKALNLNPIPEVQDLIKCGETDTVMNCFVRFYGDADNVGEPSVLPSARYVRISALSEINGLPYTAAAEINILGKDGQAIDRTNWKVSASNEEVNYEAHYAIDGHNSTIWHTQWVYTAPGHRHDFYIDLTEQTELSAIKYLPRQDYVSNGTIAKYEVYVSNDGINWGSPLKVGTLEGRGLQTIELPRVQADGSIYNEYQARYVRLTSLSEINGYPYAAAAEVNLFDAKGQVLDRSGWRVSASSIEYDTPAYHAIDGDTNTVWHTQWRYAWPGHSHEFIIDLGSVQGLGAFSYLPRQDSITNGTIADYEIHVSTDGVNWGSPVAKGKLSGRLTSFIDF